MFHSQCVLAVGDRNPPLKLAGQFSQDRPQAAIRAGPSKRSELSPSQTFVQGAAMDRCARLATITHTILTNPDESLKP